MSRPDGERTRHPAGRDEGRVGVSEATVAATPTTCRALSAGDYSATRRRSANDGIAAIQFERHAA